MFLVTLLSVHNHTWQSDLFVHRKLKALPSVHARTLGKLGALPSVRDRTLGKVNVLSSVTARTFDKLRNFIVFQKKKIFAECCTSDTRQT